MSDRTTRCTAAKRHGAFCDQESLPDAPFPICLRHASQLLRYLNDAIPDGGSALKAVRRLEATPRPVPVESLSLPGHGVELVYYMRVSSYIKIGYTTNLHQRVRFYPPDSELLAYEPGTPALERERLRQFRGDLRGRIEWFRPSPELLAHIRSIPVTRAA